MYASAVTLNYAPFFQLIIGLYTFLHEIMCIVAGAKEVEEVIKESHIFEPTNEDIDEVKACIVRVCKRLQFFMQHFSSVQRGTNPEKILESVFHCTETMLYWGLQYPGELIRSLINNLV